jgi:hypothetical protein
VNELLRKNHDVIEKIYRDSNANAIISYHAKKKYIELDEARRYVHEIGVKGISEMMIAVIFFESLVIV